MANRIPARLSTPRFTSAEGRKFGLTVGIAFLVLAAFAWWRGHDVSRLVLGTLGVILVIAGLVIPAYLGPVFRAWMGLAHAISKVTTPIFMGVVFFVVIAPVGIMMRLFGRNPIRHRPVGDSYWTARTEPRGDLTHQF